MIKTIPCINCQGTGKEEITVCNTCGKEIMRGGDEICQDCYFKTLSAEEIKLL